MRREVLLWYRQALKDFENAEKVFKLKEYYLTAFLVQQSLEKALKSLYILNKDDFPEKTHSLIYLGKELGIPKKLMSYLRIINPDFIYTRYPDMDGVSPYEAYDEKVAKDRLKHGKEVLDWISEKIKS